MNPLEERLNRLESRVTRYRNFNVLLCLLLVAVVTVAARDGVSQFQAKSNPGSDPFPDGDVPIPEILGSGVDAVMQREVRSAAKLAEQTYDAIRTGRLDIVNNAGQTVVTLAPSTVGDGLIFVNSEEGKKLVYIGSGSEAGDGLIAINSKNEKRLIGLGSGVATEDGGIWIRNKNEELLIGLNADETPGIHINGADGNLAYLGASTMDNAILGLRNKSGKRLVAMQANETSGNLWLSNSSDKTIARIGAYSEGDGFMIINSKTGTELITLGSNTADNGLIRVSNSHGTLGAWIVGADNNGYVGIQNAQERLMAELTATQGGNGLVRTLSSQGVTTWSSASVQGNTGSTSLKGDMDNDGDIDGDDFLIFSENFGKKK